MCELLATWHVTRLCWLLWYCIRLQYFFPGSLHVLKYITHAGVAITWTEMVELGMRGRGWLAKLVIGLYSFSIVPMETFGINAERRKLVWYGWAILGFSYRVQNI